MKEACPLVSIIIDNYNYAAFLPQAIESALAQAYHQIEVIVVDDGSSDASLEIIRQYGEKITPVMKKNGGQASALNAGFARSRGEIVIFLDADDQLLPGTAGWVVDAFQAQADIARVHYRMEVIDAHGKRTGRIKPYAHLPLLRGDLRPYVLQCPDDVPWLPTSGNAFATWVLQRIFPIPEADYRILADYYLSHITPLFGPVAAIEQVGAFYRVHGANNYETATPTLNLDQVRQTITYWQTTHTYIKKFADELNLPGRPAQADDVLSVACCANRLVSCKLAPHRHPIPGDTPWRLLRLGLRAVRRRFDVSWAMKFLFGVWFTTLAFAPRVLARPLAEAFLFPEKRPSVNHLLGRQHTGAQP